MENIIEELMNMRTVDNVDKIEEICITLKVLKQEGEKAMAEKEVWMRGAMACGVVASMVNHL